jgi:phosphate-selective porin OprO/OprP
LNFPRPWVYALFGATHAFDKGFDSNETESFSLFDYRLDVPLAQKLTMSVGKQKEPISMERIMSMVQEPMQERSAPADALLPSRNVGVVFSGTTFRQRSSWAAGVFNDWFVTNQDINDSASQLVGRMTGLPYISADETSLVHLGAAVRYSNAREGARALTEPEFYIAPLYVDTGVFEADSTTTLQLETSVRSGPVWVAAEYLLASTDAPGVEDPSLGGYHLTASWIVTGEMRAYNRRAGIMGPVPIARSVYQDGNGAWELGARFSRTDLTDGSLDGGEMDIWSLGANWWLSPFLSISFNYRFIALDKNEIVGKSNGFNTRLLLLLE